MNNLTKLQNQEIKSLYEMISLGWHYTNHPMYNKFMQAHNELPDYKE
jgi:hypothetical protein